MPDVFTKQKRSEVMSRIRGRGNKETEVALAKLLRKHGIKGWRRQQKLRIEGKRRRARRSRPTGDEATRRAGPKEVGGRRRAATTVGVDFVFPKQRVAVFVDGCFWHGCPKHSNPKKWVKKSSMGEGIVGRRAWSVERGAKEDEQRRKAHRMRSFDTLRMTTGGKRTGKQFWRDKMASNIARDRLVNRELRRNGWRVVRIWEHELGKGGGGRGASSVKRGASSVRRRQGYGGQGGQRVVEKIRKAIHGLPPNHPSASRYARLHG